MQNKARDLGYKAFHDGEGLTANPYAPSQDGYEPWTRAYLEAYISGGKSADGRDLGVVEGKLLRMVVLVQAIEGEMILTGALNQAKDRWASLRYAIIRFMLGQLKTYIVDTAQMIGFSFGQEQSYRKP